MHSGVSVAAPIRRVHHAPTAAAAIDRALWPVVALTLLGGILRLSELGRQSFWFDESVTVVLVHLPLPRMLAAIPATESTPPLYYAVAWVWTHVWGPGPTALRSVSALAGTALVPVAHLTARRLVGRRAALVVSALTACNPLLIWYAQEARAYSLMALFTGVTLLCCAHLADEPSRRWSRAWALFAALALCTHYFAALVVVPEWIWLAARHRRHRHVRLALASPVAVTAVLAPLAAHQMTDLVTAGNWIRAVPLDHRIADLPRTFATGPQTAGTAWQLALSAVAVIVAGWCGWTRASRVERRGIGLALGSVLAGLALIGLLLATGHDGLDYRNAIALWLPCALAVGGALGARRAGWAGATAAVMLCALGLTTAVAVRLQPQLQRPDWRGVAVALAARPGDAIIIRHGCQLLPLSLYVPGLRLAPAAGGSFRHIDVVSASGERTWTDVLERDWYVQCSPTPRGESAGAALPGFHARGRALRVGRFTVTHLTAPVPVALSAASAARAGVTGELLDVGPARG